jgi:hypothetical protein
LDERDSWIARMLGGETNTELTFEQAKEMLENAKKASIKLYKENPRYYKPRCRQEGDM